MIVSIFLPNLGKIAFSVIIKSQTQALKDVLKVSIHWQWMSNDTNFIK